MRGLRSRTVRRWLAWGMLGVLVASLGAWLATRERLPGDIRFASALPTGRYHELALALAERMERQSGRRVTVTPTAGSGENRDLLTTPDQARRADVAILQAGSVPMQGMAVVAPLYPEPIHVIVRRDRGISSISDLGGKRVAVGELQSGMRASAEELFAHYFGARPGDGGGPILVDGDFERLLAEDPAIDAAVITTGTRNAALNDMLEDGNLELIPIDDARALEMKYVHINYFEIPRGLYCGRPNVPAEPVQTIATTAVLAVREGTPDRLVDELLTVLYESDLPTRFPELIPRHEAIAWKPTSLHPAARDYLDPFDHIGWMADMMEPIAAFRELMVACVAGLYLLWDRWRRLKEREKQDEVRDQKERLDVFLEQTMAIERASTATDDPAILGRLLDDVTRIKLHAMREFTDEALRGNATFSIFLLQCSNLSSTIQLKTITATMIANRIDRPGALPDGSAPDRRAVGSSAPVG